MLWTLPIHPDAPRIATRTGFISLFLFWNLPNRIVTFQTGQVAMLSLQLPSQPPKIFALRHALRTSSRKRISPTLDMRRDRSLVTGYAALSPDLKTSASSPRSNIALKKKAADGKHDRFADAQLYDYPSATVRLGPRLCENSNFEILKRTVSSGARLWRPASERNIAVAPAGEHHSRPDHA
jgi:hypothetical protein